MKTDDAMSDYHYDTEEDGLTSVKDLRQRAAFFAKKLGDEGVRLTPVKSAKKSISSSFWGQAWNRNLNHYSMFANQLAPGRTFLRNGAVIDLCVEKGTIRGLVAAQSLCEVAVKARPVDTARWARLVERCSGSVRSLTDLMSGKLPEETLAAITDESAGLFPEPEEITFSCSCPDWTDVCVHVAAVLYGFSLRLDEEPALLFTLRSTDPADLISSATDKFVSDVAAVSDPMVESDMHQLEDLFGIDLIK
jgi:uncharacterized Zn finger protein